MFLFFICIKYFFPKIGLEEQKNEKFLNKKTKNTELIKNKVVNVEEEKKKKFSISNLMLKKKIDLVDLTVAELLEINRERGLKLPRNKSELIKILNSYLKNN